MSDLGLVPPEAAYQRQITLSASHLPGLDNPVADRESREVQTSAEWKLHEDIFKQISTLLGPLRVDFFATSAGPLCELETRPRGDGDQCISSQLGRPRRLCLSPLFTDRQVPPEGEDGTEHNCPGGSPVAEPDMVPNASGINGGVPTTSARPEGHTERLYEPTAPIGAPQQAKVSRLESLWQQHAATGVSKETSELLLAGWSKGTNTAYQSGWKRWSGWCQRREVDPISSGVQPFLDFITSLFLEWLQYRSINLIRSAVSTTHLPVDGTPIGQHPLVKQLFKGVYNSRPPQPRYTHTWDVQTVLDYITHLGDNRSLSLKQLSLKLVMLMSLASANRVSELHAMDLRFRRYTVNGVVFKLASLTKKRQTGAPLKEISFASFSANDKL